MLLVACRQVFEEGVKANAFPLLIEMLETVWARLSQEGGAGAVDDETLATQLLCASLSQTQRGMGLLRSEGLRVDVVNVQDGGLCGGGGSLGPPGAFTPHDTPKRVRSMETMFDGACRAGGGGAGAAEAAAPQPELHTAAVMTPTCHKQMQRRPFVFDKVHPPPPSGKDCADDKVARHRTR